MAVEGESIPVEVVRRMLMELTVTATGGESFDVVDEETNRFFVLGDAQAQPLYKAIKDGDAPMVEALVAVGFDMEVPHRASGEPYCALCAAALHGHVDVVRVLLAAGVIRDRAARGLQALAIAAGQGHVDVMRVLLEAGTDASPSTALRAAVRGGHPAAIQVLLDAGAEVSSDDSSLMLIEAAVENGHRCCLGPLLRAGASLKYAVVAKLSHVQRHPNKKQASALRYLKRVQDAGGGYDQLVEKYRRVLTAPQSCLSWYLKFHCEIRFRLGAFPIDLVALVLEFWKPPGGP